MSVHPIENIVTIGILFALIVVYLYLLLSPNQPRPLTTNRNFVIKRDTLANYQAFVKELKDHSYENANWYKNLYDDTTRNSSESEFNREWGANGKADDFFLDGFEEGGLSRYRDKKETT